MLHKLVEAFILSIVRKNFKIIDSKVTETLGNIIETKLQNSDEYNSNDIDSVRHYKELIYLWNKMCHKYRHGKMDQTNHNVPPELFNNIVSHGVSIYRFLLNLDEKYELL
jgi:hypothetical protein